MIEKEIAQQMIRKALQAMKKSYAPYSQFKVGACILDQNGKMYSGANIENASFSVTCCAERVALYNALIEKAEGENIIVKAVAVVGGLNGEVKNYVFPCGVCRQAIIQFVEDANDCCIIAAKNIDDYKMKILGNYFVEGFQNKDLK